MQQWEFARFARWCGVLLFAALAHSGLRAQSQGDLSLVPPPSAVECLTRVPGSAEKPVYPPDELKMKAFAKLRVQLTFEGQDTAPRIKILENSAASEFADSVKAFATQYRLPCMKADAAPLVASQEYAFNPGDGRRVVYGPAEANPFPDFKWECVKKASNPPNYPNEALNAGAAGNVLAYITFERQNEAPKVEIVYDAHNKYLARATRANLEDYQYVCPLPPGRPIKMEQFFSFRLDGDTRYAFKDVDLRDFLRMVEPSALRNIKFDLTKMGCPFDLSIKVRQPFASNSVGELGSADGSRKPFIDWLRGLTIPLPRTSEPFLIGQSLKVSVPCLVLDL